MNLGKTVASVSVACAAALLASCAAVPAYQPALPLERQVELKCDSRYNVVSGFHIVPLEVDGLPIAVKLFGSQTVRRVDAGAHAVLFRCSRTGMVSYPMEADILLRLKLSPSQVCHVRGKDHGKHVEVWAEQGEGRRVSEVESAPWHPGPQPTTYIYLPPAS